MQNRQRRGCLKTFFCNNGLEWEICFFSAIELPVRSLIFILVAVFNLLI